MSVLKKISKEIKEVFSIAAFFAIVFIVLMVMKMLYLKDYDIEFAGLSQAIIGALIMSKVIILMQMISLGKWVKRQPPMVDVLLRTLLYSVGVFIVVVLERSIEKIHEAGGFGNAIVYLFEHRNIYQAEATTIGVSFAIFVFNAFSIIKLKMGENGLRKLFFSTPLDQVKALPAADK